ncbi:hypothetical protein Ahy_A02g009174 [Arachis hypogaea]|uniref:Uncharacterized protein n=1 Tax=Arachis hypogaea TaxID=3818 RepID=A0A445EGB0_ARAHY|nr:hypothetical protein Ahy_A02g009174 [Arachis hypogaea]
MSVPSSNCIRTRVLGKLQDCPLTIWPSRLNNDVVRVLDGNNNPSSKLEVLPCLAKKISKEAWVTIIAALENVAFHLEVAVFGSEMNLSCEHHLDVLLLLRELDTDGSSEAEFSLTWT